MQRKVLLAAVAMIAVVVVIVVGGAVLSGGGTSRVTASSSAPGSDASALTDGDIDGPAVWSSDDETVGAWLEAAWPSATRVDRVRLAGGGTRTWTEALLEFDDGSTLLVASDAAGDAMVSFPERTVRGARLVVAGAADDASAVSLAHWSMDGGGTAVGPAVADDTVEVTVSSGEGAESLADGDPLAGEWNADEADDAPWVDVAFPEPREIASVQIHGPSGTWLDPAYTAAAPLNGRLVFSDSSSVRVSGIAGGGDGPTTVAFAPRVTTSVRLELRTTIDIAEVGLRAITAYGSGTPAPRWEGPGEQYSSDPLPATCADPLGSDAGDALHLVCPSMGAAVEGEAEIVIAAPPGTELVAYAWRPDGPRAATGAVQRVAEARSDATGRAAVRFSTDDLQHGPFGIRVEATGLGAPAPVTVQLYNTAGLETRTGGLDVSGRTLQWEDEFSGPLSISTTGDKATYAATKPAYWGTSDFGDAVFDQPDSGRGTYSSVGGDYLRIRALPLGDRRDTAGWGREHTGGILSSLGVGATGFSAQYGTFEARILGAPGTGTWPAFWMMNSDSATRVETTSEVDAVELYGNDRAQTCHATHAWRGDTDEDSLVECIEPTGVDDWALVWHTYGVQITPGGADFYLDGLLVASHDDLTHSDEPFFFMLNLALGGGWPVDLSQTGETTDLYVDWVRVST